MGLAILIPDEINFKTISITKDKERYYITIKGSIQEEAITIFNIYALNTGAPKYIKQILTDIKGEAENNTIIVGKFNSPLTSTDRSSTQKINKATVDLNGRLDLMDLTDIYRTLHPKTAEYTFFLTAHETFSRIYYMLGHKKILYKFKRIEIILNIFFPTTMVWN